MISDGNSKTFKLLSDQLPYGASNLVSKHECVGHVPKRMGMALREKAKEKFMNERGEHVWMRGKGWLTDKTIKLLTRYCGKASDQHRTVWHAGCCLGSVLPLPVHRQYTAPVLPQWPAVLVQVQQGTAHSEPSPSHSPTIHPDIVPPLKKVFE